MNVSTAQEEIVEQFTKLCGNPDDMDIAASADQALLVLDELLAGTEVQ